MDKAAVFIDAGYFSKVLDALSRPRIDFSKFSDVLCTRANAERLRTYYYDCMPYQSSEATESERKRFAAKDKFIARLNLLPRFAVRLGKLSYAEGIFKQKRVDNFLTADLVKLSWRGIIQKAILITGDSDFVPAIREAKEAGVITQIYYLKSKNTSVHDELLSVADEYFEITKDIIKAAFRE